MTPSLFVAPVLLCAGKIIENILTPYLNAIIIYNYKGPYT